MKCIKCENEIAIGVGQNISTKGCEILTNPTTVLTVKCNSCGEIFQLSTSLKSTLSVKKDKE